MNETNETTAPVKKTAKKAPAKRKKRGRAKGSAQVTITAGPAKPKPAPVEAPPTVEETPATADPAALVEETPRPGRPPGPAEKKPEVVGVLTRCPKCDSTAREKYGNVKTGKYRGADPVTGKPYNEISWKRTKCKTCGQARNDKYYSWNPENE